MHNVLNHVLKKLRMLHIPDMILVAAFKPHVENRTLEALIKEKIVVGIVLEDCNLYAGKLKKIILLDSFRKEMGIDQNIYTISQAYSVYEIPPQDREHRDLTHAIDVSYPSRMMGGSIYPSQYTGGKSLGSLANEVLSSFTGTPVTITPTPILMANNTVRLDPPMAAHVEWVLTCLLAYDSNFTNIAPHMIEPLSDLVVLATKAYIYNTLINNNDLAAMVGGASLDSFRSIVESYSDSYEKYTAAVLTFRGAATFDKENLVSLLREMF